MSNQLPLFNPSKHKLPIHGLMCSCIFSNESPKSIFFIKEVKHKTAMKIVVENHYLHRTAPCSKSYGLFCKSCRNILGVVVYGVSCSTTLLKGICGEEESDNVYELTRLWIKDSTPKNAESFLVGNTLKLLDKEIIVSFSEIDQGHVGVVYQATNFFYCGLSAKFTDIKVKGLEHQHHSTYANRMTADQVYEKYGKENVYYSERPRKHRYVFFNAKGRRKRDLIRKLKYEIMPYPKVITTGESQDIR